MRAALALLLLPGALAAAAALAATTGPRHSPTGIYANGVFLTVEPPDVPEDATLLLQRIRTIHTLDQLKIALARGTKVFVYDCSASSLLDSFLGVGLPRDFGLVGINVERDDLFEPKGCNRDPSSTPFFSFYHQSLGPDGCIGRGGARVNEGGLFRAFLERELRRNGSACETP